MRKKMGIVLEKQEDAKKLGLNLEHLYHWRVPKEIEAIKKGIESYGYEPVEIGTPEHFIRHIDDYQVDCIFNLSVGFISQHRLAKGPMLYEVMGIPYTGANPYTKMVTQNKHINKAFFDKMSINTPDWSYIKNGDDALMYPEFPLIVKPAYEGSSIGIDSTSLVDSEEGLIERISYMYDTLDMPLILESFIAGREFKVGIIGNGEHKEIFMIEDVKSDGSQMGNHFLYYQVKTEGVYHKVKRDIEAPPFKALKSACIKAYELFEPVDYGTFDIRMNDKGEYFIIEFNCDATLHPDRTLAKCSELHGVSYNEMIKKILDSANRRWWQ